MGTLWVTGDGMVETAVHVKQGDLLGREVDGVQAQREPKSRERWAGVRALIVARKRRNGRGAKGGRKVDAVKAGQAEAQPEAVSAGATRAGERRARWAWTEPSVWTERMLTALEEGVKGGRWYSLMDKVYHLPNLRAESSQEAVRQGEAGQRHKMIGQGTRRFASQRTARSVAGVAGRVCRGVKPVGEPDAGDLHVRFDERREETE